VSAPGRHWPQYRAEPGSRKDIQLSAGPHKFEYYHAAAGPQAVMSAAWEESPQEGVPQPKPIPAEVFRAGSVVHLPAGPPSSRSARNLPEFLFTIDGDVPLPDSELALIRVTFRDVSVRAISLGAKPRWDFGDGQTADKPQVEHVYLRPGLYAVTLSFRRGAGKVAEITQRIYIDRPRLTHKDKLHKLDDYLPILEGYEPRALDAVSLYQLALAHETKAAAVLAQAASQIAEERQQAEVTGQPLATRKTAGRHPLEEAAYQEAKRWLRAAVAVGEAAFAEGVAGTGDEELLKLVRFVAPLARDRLGDSPLAMKLWQAAAQRITASELKGECEAEAADIAINDLVEPAAAKRLLEAATTRLGNRRTGPTVALVHRVWGDCYAATGQGPAARRAYQQAEQLRGPPRRFAETTAWRGAYSRSTEDFLKSGQLERAAAELRAWQRDFPTDRIDGYLTLLYARYWAAAAKPAQAVAQVEQLLAVNRDSPYADQGLMLAAECELARKRPDRAVAVLRSLLADYPGSPLVPQAQKLLARLEGGS
jgi:tetratricopeptide (TPR) repeat protein